MSDTESDIVTENSIEDIGYEHYEEYVSDTSEDENSIEEESETEIEEIKNVKTLMGDFSGNIKKYMNYINQLKQNDNIKPKTVNKIKENITLKTPKIVISQKEINSWIVPKNVNKEIYIKQKIKNEIKRRSYFANEKTNRIKELLNASYIGKTKKEGPESMYKEQMSVLKLWNNARNSVIKENGENFYNKLKREEKFEMILKFIIKNCKELKHNLEINYLEIIQKFEKKEFLWIEKLKDKGVFIGKRKGKEMERIFKSNIKDIDPSLNEKDLEYLYNNINSNFEIEYNKDGKPVSVKSKNVDKDIIDTTKLLKKLNIEKYDSVEDIEYKLNNVKVKDNKYIKDLIVYLKDKIENVEIIKKIPEQVINNKLEDDNIIPIGEWDPDYDPNMVSVKVVYWIPKTTPTGDVRPVEDKQVLKIVKRGKYAYNLPIKLTINGKDYIFVKKFLNFYDFLKSYQEELVKKYNQTTNNINREIFQKKINNINDYFKFKLKNEKEPNVKSKLKMFINN